MARSGSVVVVHHPEGYLAIRRRVEHTGDAITRAVTADALENAPVRSGQLRTSIRSIKVGPLTWHVLVGTDHWHETEYGAKPHGPILPVKKKALWWPGLPHPISQVKIHPGNEAQPFMRPAVFKPRVVMFTSAGVAVVTG